MINCGVINCEKSSENNESEDVKGWHKVPTKGLFRQKWLTAMKRDPPYPAAKNFNLCGQHTQYNVRCLHLNFAFQPFLQKKHWLIEVTNFI